MKFTSVPPDPYLALIFIISSSTFKMSAELDPMFVRALHLLHSKHPKALEQLCALRDEVLGKKPDSPIEVC